MKFFLLLASINAGKYSFQWIVYIYMSSFKYLSSVRTGEPDVRDSRYTCAGLVEQRYATCMRQRRTTRSKGGSTLTTVEKEVEGNLDDASPISILYDSLGYRTIFKRKYVKILTGDVAKKQSQSE